MRLLRTQLCLYGRRAVVHTSYIPPLDAEAELKTRLVNSIESNSKFCKLKVIFWLKCKFNSLFHYKDTLQKKIPSNNIYKYTCSNCKATYYSKTCRQFYETFVHRIPLCTGMLLWKYWKWLNRDRISFLNILWYPEAVAHSCSVKKGVLKNSAKFKGKLRNFKEHLFLQNTSGGCFLILLNENFQ